MWLVLTAMRRPVTIVVAVVFLAASRKFFRHALRRYRSASS